ncbi:carboxypeptidase-like regulatory domain-containing protein [uncultured Pedobacter sp.]|uniref:carboxypeptidase-like regulatory domain-containing protein n=1 Tax=uncultured Pedobacter sp. TaxID=246139 RepID=UPI0025D80009|nr:carboxypeptidase regulatory-like domain-containing protein [uncultured Pedobacter sp.]
MFTRVICICFFLLICLQQVHAQSVIAGAVRDSSGTAIPGASITVINNKGAGLLFSKTDQTGNFVCKLETAEDSLLIKATVLGFKPYTLKLKNKSVNNLLIILKHSIINLQEVNVKSSGPVSKMADTLKYDVRRFKENQDRVIADVIGRMPGLQVDDKGGISFNGKRISKVYIDGENLLDRNYKLATSNIPASAISQLQVIERDQPVKALNGYVSSDDVALNLTLSDSVKTMISNNAQAGAGNKAYLADFNNMIFRKGIKGINTLKANNIGNDLQVEQEEAGQLSANEFRARDPQSYLSMQSEIIPDLQPKYYLFNNDLSASANTLLNLGQDWRLRFNLSTLQLKCHYRFNNSVSYFLTGADTVSYVEEQDNVYRLNSWKAKMQIEKNSSKLYFQSQTSLEIPNWQRRGQASQNDADFAQEQPMKTRSVYNQTKMVKVLGTETVLEYNGLLQYQKVDEQLKIMPGIHKSILNNGADYRQLKQSVFTNNIFVDESVALRKKTGRVVLSSSVNFGLEKNSLKSGLLILQDTLSEHHPGNDYINNTGFQNVEVRVKSSALYRLKKGELNVTLAPGYNFISDDNRIKQYSTESRYFSLNPAVSFRTNAGKFADMQFSYAADKSFGDVKDIYQGIILVNFRQFNSNAIPIPVLDQTSLSARYSFRKPINMFFFNIDLSYVASRQNYIRSYAVESIQTRAVAVDFDNRLKEYNIGTNISKYLFFAGLNLSFRSNIGFQQGFNFYNNDIVPYDGTQINAGTSLRRKFSNQLSLLLMYDFMKATNRQKAYNGSLTENVVSNHKLRAEWNHRIGHKLSYQLNYNLISFNQSFQNRNQQSFLDFNFRYSPGKTTGVFEFQCINLIGQQAYTQSSSNTNELSIYDMPLRQRTFLIKYSFNF